MRWTEGLRGLDFRPTPFRLEWMQDAADDIEASSEFLLNIIRETEPDLLHFSQYCYGSVGCRHSQDRYRAQRRCELVASCTRA